MCSFFSLAYAGPATPSNTVEINESQSERCEDWAAVKILCMLKTKANGRGNSKKLSHWLCLLKRICIVISSRWKYFTTFCMQLHTYLTDFNWCFTSLLFMRSYVLVVVDLWLVDMFLNQCVAFSHLFSGPDLFLLNYDQVFFYSAPSHRQTTHR